jgi:acetate kinase
VDALVFAGGIGEKSADLRRAVVEKVACLGFAVDGDKNQKGVQKVVEDVSVEGKRRVLVCQTDEQFEMARSCAADEKLFG